MNDPRAQAMFQEASRQRNSFADLCVNLRGELAVKDAEIARLKAELEKLSAQQKPAKRRRA